MAVAVQERLPGSTAAVPMASKYAWDAGSFWAYQHRKHWQKADRLMLTPCVSPAETWSGYLATHTLAEKETWVSCAPPICKPLAACDMMRSQTLFTGRGADVGSAPVTGVPRRGAPRPAAAAMAAARCAASTCC